MSKSKQILILIVLAQFCCTSLWFASNAIIEQLISAFSLAENCLGMLTSFVQFGFIAGTLLFALSNIADRFAPSLVFFGCAIAGSLFNAGLLLESNQYWSILTLRFLTGFSLAGIYPIGMKIAADYFEKGLGLSLGYLVGALVLGTALPHLFTAYSTNIPWQSVLIIISILSALGGILVLAFVPSGPYRSPSQELQWHKAFSIFKQKDFNAAAFGYFGHMWELYAFWTFLPLLLIAYFDFHQIPSPNISLVSFLIIGLGSAACILGGYWAEKTNPKKVATQALVISTLCCLLIPVLFLVNSPSLFLSFVFLWGFFVIMDSPMLSTLVAQTAPAAFKGTALTIVTCIGFAITIFSIQLLSFLVDFIPIENTLPLLAIGPIVGLIFLRK